MSPREHDMTSLTKLGLPPVQRNGRMMDLTAHFVRLCEVHGIPDCELAHLALRMFVLELEGLTKGPYAKYSGDLVGALHEMKERFGLA